MNSGSSQAVIDLGSHSALLLIGRLNASGQIEPLVQEFAVTRLAEDLPATGNISEAAIKRMHRVLQRFRQRIEEQRAAGIQVVATEVLRRAANSTEVAAFITQHFGWPVKVLSPQEEGLYAYRGSLSDPPPAGQKILIADVGGGSTELIIGRGRNIVQVASLPIGALNLAQKIHLQEQLCSSDRLGLMQYLKLAFAEIPFWRQLNGQYQLIGSGGTATTLAALQLKLKTYDYQRINRSALSREQLWRWFFKLNELDVIRRRQLPGMEAGREDVIVYGALIFLTLMELKVLDVLHIRQGGVRFGYLADMLSLAKQDKTGGF